MQIIFLRIILTHFFILILFRRIGVKMSAFFDFMSLAKTHEEKQLLMKAMFTEAELEMIKNDVILCINYMMAYRKDRFEMS